MVAAPPPIAFLDFAHSLEAAFRRADYAESAFPELAVEHVERARLHETFDLGALARWVLAGSALPPQQDIAAKFGDPPITVWAGRRFFVSVLVWRTSTTSIHQHAFTGAFQVLQGSSVHSRFEFDTRRVFSEDLAIGTLRNVCVERLERGWCARSGRQIKTSTPCSTWSTRQYRSSCVRIGTNDIRRSTRTTHRA